MRVAAAQCHCQLDILLGPFVRSPADDWPRRQYVVKGRHDVAAALEKDGEVLCVSIRSRQKPECQLSPGERQSVVLVSLSTAKQREACRNPGAAVDFVSPVWGCSGCLTEVFLRQPQDPLRRLCRRNYALSIEAFDHQC